MKSLESGILEPRKDTKLLCSTILRTPSAVSFSLSSGRFSCVSCLTLGNDESVSCIGSGNTYCFIPSFLFALGGIEISVGRSERGVGF